jgi:ankyrin repeat protein
MTTLSYRLTLIQFISYITVRMVLYCKVTNEKENHNGHQYIDGLNYDARLDLTPIHGTSSKDTSNDRRGLYYTDIENVCRFIYNGFYVRDITLPEDDSTFKSTNIQPDAKNHTDPKYKPDPIWFANKLILGKRRPIHEVATFEYLVENGANIRICDDRALIYCAEQGYLDVVKYLVQQGADVNAANGSVLCRCVWAGKLDVVKFVIEKGANIIDSFRKVHWQKNHPANLEIAMYLVEHGADYSNLEGLVLPDDILNYLKNLS